MALGPEIDISVSKLLSFETFADFLRALVSVSEKKFGFRKIWSEIKGISFGFKKNLVSEKNLGFDFGKFGLGKKVSVSVKIWYRRKVSVSVSVKIWYGHSVLLPLLGVLGSFYV